MIVREEVRNQDQGVTRKSQSIIRRRNKENIDQDQENQVTDQIVRDIRKRMKKRRKKRRKR
jgi:hypothetical protein